jgi:hypothetical protein
MTTKAGSSASIAATIFSRWISASTRTLAPARPSRRERKRNLRAAFFAGDVQHAHLR